MLYVIQMRYLCNILWGLVSSGCCPVAFCYGESSEIEMLLTAIKERTFSTAVLLIFTNNKYNLSIQYC